MIVYYTYLKRLDQGYDAKGEATTEETEQGQSEVVLGRFGPSVRSQPIIGLIRITNVHHVLASSLIKRNKI